MLPGATDATPGQRQILNYKGTYKARQVRTSYALFGETTNVLFSVPYPKMQLEADLELIFRFYIFVDFRGGNHLISGRAGH